MAVLHFSIPQAKNMEAFSLNPSLHSITNPWSKIYSPQDFEMINLCLLSHIVCGTLNGSPSRLSTGPDGTGEGGVGLHWREWNSWEKSVLEQEMRQAIELPEGRASCLSCGQRTIGPSL